MHSPCWKKEINKKAKYKFKAGDVSGSLCFNQNAKIVMFKWTYGRYSIDYRVASLFTG